MVYLEPIVGIDEVGRGCLAGPLVAGAVVLGKPIIGLKDSKLLSKNQRELLSEIIYNSCASFGIGWVDADYINKNGLTASVIAAMEMALSKINVSYKTIVIDGNFNFLRSYKNVSTQVGADKSIPQVSAASIIAKVYRDKWMEKLAGEFPAYGFEKHVGYGTKLHLERIKVYGPCIQHRMFYKTFKNPI